MQEKEARLVFDGGGYSKAVIVPTVMDRYGRGLSCSSD